MLAPVLAVCTMVPRLTLEQLVDQSEAIVQGTVLRSWSSWDPAHKFIWTHHELRLTDSLKNAHQSTMIVSEPGGSVGGINMQIAGALKFTPGEENVLFLYRTPIGYWRTVGYGQGKYNVADLAGRRVQASTGGVTLVKPNQPVSRRSETALESVHNMTLHEFKSRVRGLVIRRNVNVP